MKFFSKLRSCYFGSTITPAPETTTSPPPRQEPLTEKLASKNIAPTTKNHSAQHWKPALAVISEDNSSFEMRNRNTERKVMSKMKSSTKPRSTKTRSVDKKRYFSHSDVYGDNCNTMALPAFSPTPFVF